jgi:hypothetical protein
MQILEYDMLYGDMLSYGEGFEYVSPDMKLGIREIKVSGVSFVDDNYYVLGENFTKSSKVYVNGKGKNTLFVSPDVIILEDYEPVDGDIITVRQVTNDFVELSETEIYVFTGVSKNDTVIPEASED